MFKVTVSVKITGHWIVRLGRAVLIWYLAKHFT